NIGEAATLSGLPPKTIRYYESIGLIEAAPRTNGGYRSYDGTDVQFLRFIRRARGLGFSVEDVAGLLALYRDKSRASADVKALALRHRERIDRKIAELGSIRRTLDHLIDKCHGDERPECPILDDLAGELEAVSEEPAADRI
ncbi:MAG: Cu(I)-responsive transcriptional regulator, partial [Alphaproteobacteria bacterium]